MKNLKTYLENVKNAINAYRGRCAMYCFDDNMAFEVIVHVCKLYLTKNPNKKMAIVVTDRLHHKMYNKLFDVEHDFFCDKFVKVFSSSFAVNMNNLRYDFCIILGCNTQLHFILNTIRNHIFTLAIFNRKLDDDFHATIRKHLHFIDTKDDDVAEHYDTVYSSVLMKLIPVEMSDKDKEDYVKYHNYITDSLTIFNGDLKNIEKCRMGDPKNNISAATFRDAFARANGWSEFLDTSGENQYLSDIDFHYNPNRLLERATDFFKVTKLREDLATDCEAKFNHILEICKNEEGKGILIVSKRGEFASAIAKYLNNNNLSCGEYHDCIEDKEITTENGKKKVIKSQAQSTVYQNLYNIKAINILSIKSTSNPKLSVQCDVVIFTSPYCEDVVQFKSRFINLKYDNVLKAYLLYCVNTKEEEKVLKLPKYSNVEVINEVESATLFTVAEADEI